MYSDLVASHPAHALLFVNVNSTCSPANGVENNLYMHEECISFVQLFSEQGMPMYLYFSKKAHQEKFWQIASTAAAPGNHGRSRTSGRTNR